MCPDRKPIIANTMELIPLYFRMIEKNGLQTDSEQLKVVTQLQNLQQALPAHVVHKKRKHCFLFRLFYFLRIENEATRAKSIYLWGGPGRGKTLLMDFFLNQLSLKEKKRTHFHRFMKQIHQQMALLKGVKNPIEVVAHRISQNTTLICLDEFFIHDIGDAMIMSGLLKSLFEWDVILIITSNIEPSKLYKEGLQRARFLPAIALIEQNMQVIHLDNGTDYRFRHLHQHALFYYPHDDAARCAMHKLFFSLIPASARIKENVNLFISGRCINAIRVCGTIVWFTFDELCNSPRCVYDYSELATQFHVWLIEGVPQFTHVMDDQARRFIYLVDECYDRGINLVISAETAMDKLGPGGRLKSEFQRTLSRLIQMQSEEYIARPWHGMTEE